MQVVMMLLGTHDKIADNAPRDDVQKIGGFAMKLASEGKLKGGQQLRGLEEGFRVASDGEVGRIIDGPHAELKELVGGYFELEVESMEEAKAIAAQCPHLNTGSVVVMPVVPRGQG